jgi:predicted RNA-binding Zn-ribbon protein involved in translation (DUF1610 family)
MKTFTMQPSATNAVSGSNAQLEHQCPQCGAGVNLAETDRIFTCPFCRVRLFISQASHFSYFIVPPSSVDARSCFFIPYFRFRGARYTLSDDTISPGFIDHSVIASSLLSGFPRTLGVRTQSLRMKFVEPASSGIFLPVQERLESVKTAVAGTAPGVSVFIGETASCVYAPYFINGNSIFDAVNNSEVCTLTENMAGLIKDERPEFPLFLSTLCPSCGWGLEGERDSLVLVCRHCGKAWHASGNTLRELDVSVWDAMPSGTVDAWVPFWRLSVQPQRCALATMADFIRLTNAPMAVMPAMEQQQFYFWVPAFKANPELFLRLSRIVTLHQKHCADAPELPCSQKSVFFPVTLPSSECFEAVPIVLAESCVAKKKIVPLLENETFTLSSARLVLLPCILKGQEYVQPDLNMGINVNALKWGRTL